jgi:hypothetical protein
VATPAGTRTDPVDALKKTVTYRELRRHRAAKRTKPKLSRTVLEPIDHVRIAVNPYRVSSDRSFRMPRVRATTARTRTAFYVREPARGIPRHDESSAPPDEISIAVYLDTEDEGEIARVLDQIEALRQWAGLGPERDIDVQRGSIFRRSWTTAQKAFSSREVRERIVKLERALELAVVDKRQADYDNVEAQAIKNLIESLQNVPRACVRSGSGSGRSGLSPSLRGGRA